MIDHLHWICLRQIGDFIKMVIDVERSCLLWAALLPRHRVLNFIRVEIELSTSNWASSIHFPLLFTVDVM